ncbi:DUF58 domain-containing protein [Bacteriovorax stolpii]|uniref:DUF58 domain-containing protein n=1 Tax=Bacteriovorax stolpii TaxID=960 RepID=A0A2K9NM94_BACTC|nr:DUF58 domain-containing protein [Bacteriovorax stolpii]AUN96629.1 hypothetical protein C0V70_00605 [Bacteriovorax stolpii]QDK43439.1 DUF58 domain-containing protein [Bacteriovorax stolpii]TDP53850.1 uncharacterized protein DUF58 [Bacteriovorax stolpii]
MNINEVRKVVGKLRANLFRRANSHSVGMLKTNIKGTGLQFKEHQVYTFGDDIRFIDWKILAKTSNPYVKTFNEERNVEIVVVIDASSTMMTGFNGVSKLQAAIEICCLLYLLAKETNDFVHALIVTDEVINVPKLSGDQGITHLISTLEEKEILTSKGKINTERYFEENVNSKQKYISIMKHLSRKREIILLSDFNDFVDSEILKKLLVRSNVHCFQLLSPLDEAKTLPYSLHASSGPNARSTVGKYDFSGKKDLNNEFGKRFRRLRVQEKYLENFVKEMR